MKKPQFHVLDLGIILEAIKPEPTDKADVPRTLATLNNAEIDGRKFRFVFTEKFFVRCPKCDRNKRKLYKRDTTYRCRECWKLAYTPVKRKKRRSGKSTVYTRYLRPLGKLAALEKKLFSANLTDRQRLLLENKAAKLKKAIPEYIQLIKDEILEAIKKETS